MNENKRNKRTISKHLTLGLCMVLWLTTALVPVSADSTRIREAVHVDEGVCSYSIEEESMAASTWLTKCVPPFCEGGSCELPPVGCEMLECLPPEILAPVADGVSASSCFQPGSAVCAFAAADTHREKINNAPNMGVAATAGHGQSNEPLLGGTAVIETTLGSYTCNFGPGEGCGKSWTDLSNDDDCKYHWVHAKTTATLNGIGGGILPPGLINTPDVAAVAVATDAVCESR